MTDSGKKPQLDDFDKMDEIASSLKKQMSKLSGSQSYEEDEDFFQSGSKQAPMHNSKELLSTYKLKFVLTGLVGLLIVISVFSYFFLGQDEGLKQQQSIDLSEKPENSLTNNNSNNDSNLYLTPENNRVKKIPLTYVDGDNENEGLNEQKVAEEEIATVDLSKPGNNIELPAKKKDKPAEVITHQTFSQPVESTETPSIKQITPNIVIGSNSRQKIILRGENYTADTQVKVSWTSGSSHKSKLFSAKRTPSQFLFLNKNEIQLRLTTGIDASDWQLLVINQGIKSNQFFFKITPPFKAEKVIAKKDSEEKATPKKNVDIKPPVQLAVSPQASNGTTSSSSDSIVSTAGSNYTVQLTGSSSASSIKRLIEKYKNVTPLELMESTRAGADWYTLLYGSFNSRNEASTAYNNLPAELKKNKPWIRSIASVQKQLGMNAKPLAPKENKDKPFVAPKEDKVNTLATPKTIKNPQVVNEAKPIQDGKNALVKSNEVVVSEQKILTINPLRWTLQLLSTSSLSSLKQFIAKHQLESESFIYQQVINGSERYKLIYGAYSSKSNAQFAIQKLPKEIQAAKPWARKYQDIQKVIRAN